MMLKRLGAGLIGWIVFAIVTFTTFKVSGHDPHAPQSAGFIALTTCIGIAAAFGGGFSASSIARGGSHFTAAFIAIGALGSLLGANATSKWSQIVALVLIVPAALVGGRVAERKRD